VVTQAPLTCADETATAHTSATDTRRPWITGGHLIAASLRRLGLRRSEVDHAVRLQNGDDVTQVDQGSLEPGGQLVLTLKAAERGATKADVAELASRLGRIERVHSAAR